ncbi:MAG: sigma factor [Planctomycetota bacterium]
MRTPDPEDLLAHAAPLRRLARRLVADEARADDLVQDTWLAALRRPPGEERNLRGWLFDEAAIPTAGQDLPPISEAMGFDLGQSQFLFFDRDGVPLVAIPAPPPRYDRRPREGGTVEVERWDPSARVGEEDPPIPFDALRFHLVVPSARTPKESFLIELFLKLETGAIGDDWK